MTAGGFRFERFSLDPGDRRLMRDGAPVELNARYLDALALLVGEAGRLVSKDRFLAEVWRGVPVTDEALTQCIKTLRRQLGDDAARPRFIETVPKHGYRFIAPVETIGGQPAESAHAAASPYRGRSFLLLGGAGTLGAGVAGIIGGLFYGFAGAAQPSDPGIGAASVLLVILWLTIAAALTGGGGVAFGAVVGGVVKLLGLDAFNLLLGQSPGDITGAGEGLLLGSAVGLGAWLASRAGSLRRGIAIAGAAGGAGGSLIPLLGGRMMGGSLDLLAHAFADSRLRLDQIGALFGEQGLGPVSQVVTGALEGALFAGCITGAMMLARRNLGLAR